MGESEKAPGGRNELHSGVRTAHSVIPLTLAAYTAADLFSKIVACGYKMEEKFAATLLGAMRGFCPFL